MAFIQITDKMVLFNLFIIYKIKPDISAKKIKFIFSLVLESLMSNITSTICWRVLIGISAPWSASNATSV